MAGTPHQAAPQTIFCAADRRREGFNTWLFGRFLVFNVPPISRTPLISRLAPADATLPNRTAALVDAINGHLRPRIDQFRQLTGAAVVFYANRHAKRLGSR